MCTYYLGYSPLLYKLLWMIKIVAYPHTRIGTHLSEQTWFVPKSSISLKSCTWSWHCTLRIPRRYWWLRFPCTSASRHVVSAMHLFVVVRPPVPRIRPSSYSLRRIGVAPMWWWISRWHTAWLRQSRNNAISALNTCSRYSNTVLYCHLVLQTTSVL